MRQRMKYAGWWRRPDSLTLLWFRPSGVWWVKLIEAGRAALKDKAKGAT